VALPATSHDDDNLPSPQELATETCHRNLLSWFASVATDISIRKEPGIAVAGLARAAECLADVVAPKPCVLPVSADMPLAEAIALIEPDIRALGATSGASIHVSCATSKRMRGDVAELRLAILHLVCDAISTASPVRIVVDANHDEMGLLVRVRATAAGPRASRTDFVAASNRHANRLGFQIHEAARGGPTSLDRWITVTQAPEKEASKDPDQNANPMVMVIDDDKSVRESLASAMGMMGYDVISASSSEDALSGVARIERHPDLILSDLSIDGTLDGIDAAVALRRKGGRQTPTVILTGYWVPEVEARCRDLNMTLLRKPVDFPVLSDTLSTLLKR
jgi:CheY-like chemotaxis protein